MHRWKIEMQISRTACKEIIASLTAPDFKITDGKRISP
jgi:hypothetical protein